MKQTKPFGRASILSIAEPDSVRPEPTPSPVAESSASSTATFSQASAPAPQSPKPQNLIRKLLLAVVLIPVLLTGYVLMRDSIRARNAIDPLATSELVMYCKDGSISYEGMDLLDRLLGNGYFACNDWHTGSRFVVLPK